MRIVAVNDVMIIDKDHGGYKSTSGLILPEQMKSDNMMEIPEPYTGTIDSIGVPDGQYEVGERIAFCDVGGLFIQIDDKEYVVINKGMVIGKIWK